MNNEFLEFKMPDQGPHKPISFIILCIALISIYLFKGLIPALQTNINLEEIKTIGYMVFGIVFFIMLILLADRKVARIIYLYDEYLIFKNIYNKVILKLEFSAIKKISNMTKNQFKIFYPKNKQIIISNKFENYNLLYEKIKEKMI